MKYWFQPFMWMYLPIALQLKFASSYKSLETMFHKANFTVNFLIWLSKPFYFHLYYPPNAYEKCFGLFGSWAKFLISSHSIVHWDSRKLPTLLLRIINPCQYHELKLLFLDFKKSIVGKYLDLIILTHVLLTWNANNLIIAGSIWHISHNI